MEQPESLTDRILDFLTGEDRPACLVVYFIQTTTSFRESTVRRAIHRLEQAGRIARIGSSQGSSLLHVVNPN